MLLSKEVWSTNKCIQEMNSFPKLEYTSKSGKIYVGIVKKGFEKLNGYLYEDQPSKKMNIPIFREGKVVWMSLAPMEIQSHWAPIEYCKRKNVRKVGVGGLGLGYFIWKLMKLKNLKEIHVYEINKDVIAAFEMRFPKYDRKKIIIHQKSALAIKGESFDFFYNDIYARLLQKGVFADMAKLTSKNKIKQYHFWGMELAMLEMEAVDFDSYGLQGFWYEEMFELVDSFFSSKKANFFRVHGFGKVLVKEFKQFKKNLAP